MGLAGMKTAIVVMAVAGWAVWATATPAEVRVSDFGYEATDATEIIQKAFDSGARRVIVDAAKGVYESGTNFHAQMSKVGAIANATADDLETLTQKALEMGSTTSFTASEAGEAMEYMAMAGWKTGEMLDGIKPIMDLAAASGESLGTTSDIVTDALTAMGYSAKDAEHFANVMAAASTNANTNVSMMGESFKYIAPLAGTMGYSIDDLAVALGVMANSGIKASQAGTSLQRILNNMIKPTEKQEAAMKELGLSLYDSEGAAHHGGVRPQKGEFPRQRDAYRLQGGEGCRRQGRQTDQGLRAPHPDGVEDLPLLCGRAGYWCHQGGRRGAQDARMVLPLRRGSGPASRCRYGQGWLHRYGGVRIRHAAECHLQSQGS